jgi:hypothetical protein
MHLAKSIGKNVRYEVRNEWKKKKRVEGRVCSRNNKAYMKKWVDVTLYVVMRILPYTMEVCCVIGVHSYVDALVFIALQDWNLSLAKSLYEITGRGLFLAIPERASTSAASDTAIGRFCEASIIVEGQISEPWY